MKLARLAHDHPTSDHETKRAAEHLMQDHAAASIDEAESIDLTEARTIVSDALGLTHDCGARDLLERGSASSTGTASKPTLPDDLTEREVEVLRLVAQGKSNRDISEALFITPNTVANHVKRILSKTGTSNRTEAAAYAKDRGLT